MTPGGRKVVVIGAQGALGRLCVPALRRAGLEVIRAGRRPESAGDFRLIDANDAGAVAKGCADADLVISMVNDANRNAERFILDAGGAMFTIIVSPEKRAELKALGADAEGLVVTDVGLGPGVTSLVLADQLARHPDAEELESAATFSMSEPAGRGTAEDFVYPWLTGVKRHPTAMVEFPQPFGKLHCIEFRDAQAALGLIGDLALERRARIYGYTLEAWARTPIMALNSLGLMSKLPRPFLTFGSERRARSTVAKPQAHVCAVLRGGRRLEASAVVGKGNFVMTAAAIATCAKVLLDRRAEGDPLAGVRGIEDVFKLSEVKDGFEEQGVRIEAMASK